MKTKAKMIAYWVTTAVLSFELFSGAALELTCSGGTLETMTILGYPAYLLTILAIWKVLGAIVILLPRFPRLKEWAYAGIFFNMTGAAVSWVFVRDYGIYANNLIVPLFFACLTLASWGLRPQSRILRSVNNASTALDVST